MVVNFRPATPKERMRVHRIFVHKLVAGELRLSGTEAHHLVEVLRVKPGALVRAFDGEGLEAQAEVKQVDDMSVKLWLEPPKQSSVEPNYQITVAVALLKGDKLTEVVRRGTELGAVCFLPFVSKRSEVRVISANKLERWRRVAKEAAKQSGRSVVPLVETSTISELKPQNLGLVAQPGSANTLSTLIKTQKAAENANFTIVTGPEGDLTEQEVALLLRQGFREVNLGARILRAETAPIALTAAILLPEAL